MRSVQIRFIEAIAEFEVGTQREVCFIRSNAHEPSDVIYSGLKSNSQQVA